MARKTERPAVPAGPPGRLDGKVAVVTGASRGIGLAIAAALAGQGCALALMARDTRRLENKIAAAAPGGVSVMARNCDVRKARDVTAFFAAVKKRFPRIDFLVNNAGISHAMHEVDQLPVQLWDDNIATNLTGIFLCTRAAVPLMGQGSVIVNNLSVAAKDIFPGESAYVASKWGALGFTNCIREELRARGIRVVALMPGATDTGIWSQFWPEAPREKMMGPGTVAAAVLHALTTNPKSAIEEIVLNPMAGRL